MSWRASVTRHSLMADGKQISQAGIAVGVGVAGISRQRERVGTGD